MAPSPASRESQSLEKPHLAKALLEAEAEEQAGQEQARRYQEEAEVREVLAEVRGAAGGGEGRLADGNDGQGAARG
jgi:hypothetical protein